jgi:hypothetical protein
MLPAGIGYIYMAGCWLVTVLVGSRGRVGLVTPTPNGNLPALFGGPFISRTTGGVGFCPLDRAVGVDPGFPLRHGMRLVRWAGGGSRTTSSSHTFLPMHNRSYLDRLEVVQGVQLTWSQGHLQAGFRPQRLFFVGFQTDQKVSENMRDAMVAVLCVGWLSCAFYVQYMASQAGSARTLLMQSQAKTKTKRRGSGVRL